LLFLTFCKAQTPIIDLYGNEDYGVVDGAYYKDVTGFLNQYVGTWLYSNGNTQLQITFVKKNQKYVTGKISFYEDVLIGEYSYVENGIEKVNTLNQVSTDFGSNSIDLRYHHLVEVSCIYYPQTYPKCNECFPKEKRLRMVLSDPHFSNIKGLSNSFVIRKFETDGMQKIKVWFYSEIQGPPEDEKGNPFDFKSFSLPFGEYTLVKQ